MRNEGAEQEQVEGQRFHLDDGTAVEEKVQKERGAKGASLHDSNEWTAVYCGDWLEFEPSEAELSLLLPMLLLPDWLELFDELLF